jgi:hypothetical protein
MLYSNKFPLLSNVSPISESGIYLINGIINLKTYGKLGLLKNNILINHSITSSNIDNKNIFMHFITCFNKGDKLKLINLDNKKLIYNQNLIFYKID